MPGAVSASALGSRLRSGGPQHQVRLQQLRQPHGISTPAGGGPAGASWVREDRSLHLPPPRAAHSGHRHGVGGTLECCSDASGTCWEPSGILRYTMRGAVSGAAAPPTRLMDATCPPPPSSPPTASVVAAMIARSAKCVTLCPQDVPLAHAGPCGGGGGGGGIAPSHW